MGAWTNRQTSRLPHDWPKPGKSEDSLGTRDAKFVKAWDSLAQDSPAHDSTAQDSTDHADSGGQTENEKLLGVATITSPSHTASAFFGVFF